MAFVSYAQNFEDVMLWRALQAAAPGFYIDVGAQDPDRDSVTRAFYDRGWRGINIEPLPSSARRFRAARLRDVNLCLALGRAPGVATLHAIEGTGLSTLDPDAADGLARLGLRPEPVEVEVTTLAAVCRTHLAGAADGAIHFLKVDVEGAEADVLAGADFARFRPWVVLVEATAPQSARAAQASWEPDLLASGYRFAWFDGLNRFYCAEERGEALADAFAAPPNVFDDFVRVADTELARRIAEADAAAQEAARQNFDAARAAREAALRAGAALAGRQAAAAMDAREIGRLHQAVKDRTERFEAIIAELGQDLATARAEAALLLAQARAEADGLRASTSWRITAPLRRVAGLARPSPPPAPAAPASAAARTASPAPAPSLLASERVVGAVAPPPPGPRRAVHQFHSGSAVGDAVTNAMLLMRSRLRMLGFESEVFVEHLDPGLAGLVLPLETLPTHADYVLIQHHSMGFDAFDRIAALPAPKVLMYHNITPPDLLDDYMRRYAELGRVQLARLRPHVAAALADSDYNAIELRRLGFPLVRTCTMLFDPAALRARAAAPSAARRTAEFTILFVGRVLPAKGQDELVDAYARFCGRWSGPSRLVIVGRYGEPAYAEALNARIAAAGLQDRVTVTGFVDDGALHEWYSAADLYVSMSRHEGFGVPLVEAMAYGIPVLARPAGAVPYTLAGAGMLLDDAAPGVVAAEMLALAGNAPRRAAIAARQREALDGYALDRQSPALVQALAVAGAPVPDDAELRARLAAHMRFTITGHASGSYSLAAINRDLALALEAGRPGRVRLAPVEGAAPAELGHVPERQRAAVGELAARGRAETGPELVISQHYPVYAPADRGDVCAALFFWEESLVPAETAAMLGASFDGVLTASRFVAKALVDSGVSIPVRVIGHAPDLAPFFAVPPKAAGGVFTFLHVSSAFPRKGVDALLAAWARAFRAGEAVRLVIKAFPNPHNDSAAQVDALRAADPGAAEIELIDRDLTQQALLALLAEADAVVLPTRGEGFNLPAAEAMAAGRPLIVTGFGGHMDFCSAETARLVQFTFAPSGSHLATPHSVWAEPDVGDLAAALREAVAQPAASAARADRARLAARTLADGAGLARRTEAAAVDWLLAPPSPALRVGWVSTWNVPCGIAEYSRQAIEAVRAADPAMRLTVLCDLRTAAQALPIPVLPAWDAHAPQTSAQLRTALEAADPMVVVVQHQPGLFSWGALADLLGQQLAPRTVVVMLHNTRNLLDVAATERQRTAAALRLAARVLVHTLADLNLLLRLGLVDNVALLPHGTPPRRAAPAARALAPHDAPVVGCYGFFLPGKGIGPLISAMALLRRDWPQARLRLVNADYGTADAAVEMAACRTLADQLGVPVEWRTEFLPQEESVALLEGCDVVALPYQASKEASSAALRTALGAGPPVAVTPLPLFDEAADAVVRFSGLDPAAMAAGLGALLADQAARTRSQERAASWLAEREWSAVGTRLAGLLRGLVRGAEARSPPG